MKKKEEARRHDEQGTRQRSKCSNMRRCNRRSEEEERHVAELTRRGAEDDGVGGRGRRCAGQGWTTRRTASWSDSGEHEMLSVRKKLGQEGGGK